MGRLTKCQLEFPWPLFSRKFIEADKEGERGSQRHYLLVLVIELEEDAGAAQVEEDEDEEGHVAHVHRHVQQVDQLLPTLHLQ